MEKAIKLAEKGRGYTSPNPLVGAVIVKDGNIVGAGFHAATGKPHAEINALRVAGDKAEGATLYVTLEPCSIYGKTPPCTGAIKIAKIKRVVAGIMDPNPKVNGKGLAELKQAGIDIDCGLLENKIKKQNEIYIKYIKTGFPFVLVKSAASLDGKIATTTGESRWISGKKSRYYAHLLRGEYDAVMVGSGTIRRDDPMLTCRLPDNSFENPIRIVIDSKIKIPMDAKVLLTAKDIPTILVTHDKSARAIKIKVDILRQNNIEVVILEEKNGFVDLQELLKKLGQNGISSILVEGGSTLNGTLLEQGLIDKFVFFLAPKIIGGSTAPTPVGGKGIDKMNEALDLEISNIKQVGLDLMVTAYPKKKEPEQIAFSEMEESSNII